MLKRDVAVGHSWRKSSFYFVRIIGVRGFRSLLVWNSQLTTNEQTQAASCSEMADRNDRRSRLRESDAFKSGSDEPPNSRLFIVCGKQLTEEDFRSAFSKYGEIEEIWVVKDRNTGERKGIPRRRKVYCITNSVIVCAGVTYIKYAKTSEAAAALEAMNGKTLGSSSRHIKVMIAAR